MCLPVAQRMAEHHWGVWPVIPLAAACRHCSDSTQNEVCSFVCQWTRFHFLLAKSETRGLVRAAFWVSSLRRVIVDLLWPLAQRGPDQIGHFDQNLIGYNGVIPSSAGYRLHMTPNKNHMLLSVKTDALMDVSERTPPDGRRAAKHPIANATAWLPAHCTAIGGPIC